ncbi:MAG: hypothetical protein HY939_06720 [Gammaproteobacteria bacterium]|nr:hypothetical protein [Gammaproteobacteria bacterium]
MNSRFFPLFLLLGIGSPLVAHADGNSAMTFAAQAGSIAGAAQACGQDVSEFTNRVNQSLAILADTTDQITQARQAYQTYMATATQKQAQAGQIPCTQVAKDYNSMPLMQSGYEQTVLPQLRQSSHKTVTFLPTENAPGDNQPSGGQLVNGGIPGTPSSATEGIPNTPSNAATGGIPNIPSDYNAQLILPSPKPGEGSTSIPTLPSQFQSNPPANSANTPNADAGISYSASPTPTQQMVTGAPAGSSNSSTMQPVGASAPAS